MMTKARLNARAEKAVRKAIQEQKVDPREIVLVTKSESVFELFQKLLPSQFKLIWPKDVGFVAELDETASMLNSVFDHAVKVGQFLREQEERYTVVAEATELQVKISGEKEDWDYKYRYPESNPADYLEYLSQIISEDDDYKAILSCVLTIVPSCRPTTRIWTCAGSACGKIITRDRRGTGIFPLDEYFAPDGLGGKTLAEITSSEYVHYSHYARAIQHMLDRFPYGS